MPEDREGDLAALLAGVREERLRREVARFAGPRHGQRDPRALAERAGWIEEALTAAGLAVRRDPFRHGRETFFNLVADVAGRRPELPPYLAGAHFDAHAGSPGADDNASGVAALLEVARALARHPPRRGVRLVAFNLEERQRPGDWRCKHGSRHFARRARLRGERYAGAFILESVGYADARPGSQRVPGKLPVPVPEAGDFLAVVGNRRARAMMAHLRAAAARHVPGLKVVSAWFPLRGWLLPVTRMSDHAPFWDWGYPAAMLTDTAFLRNPHYHRAGDLPGTLDYAFLAGVARALIAALATG